MRFRWANTTGRSVTFFCTSSSFPSSGERKKVSKKHLFFGGICHRVIGCHYTGIEERGGASLAVSGICSAIDATAKRRTNIHLRREKRRNFLFFLCTYVLGGKGGRGGKGSVISQELLVIAPSSYARGERGDADTPMPGCHLGKRGFFLSSLFLR